MYAAIDTGQKDGIYRFPPQLRWIRESQHRIIAYIGSALDALSVSENSWLPTRKTWSDPLLRGHGADALIVEQRRRKAWQWDVSRPIMPSFSSAIIDTPHSCYFVLLSLSKRYRVRIRAHAEIRSVSVRDPRDRCAVFGVPAPKIRCEHFPKIRVVASIAQA